MPQQKSESPEVLFRRFNRTVQMEKLLSEAKKRSFFERRVSRNLRKKNAMRRMQINQTRQENYGG